MEKRKLRNIGIIAHVDAGKTTTTERILFYTGKTHRIGEVHEANTVMDSDQQEKARGITINSAATTVLWRDCQFNLIDTPGHIDFNIEVNRSLRVLDGAVVVFDGVAGVEPQTETNWRLADQYGVPRIAFINKLDRVGADFDRVAAMIAERLGVRVLALHLPLGREAEFTGVIDLLTQRALYWPHGDKAQPMQSLAIPAELAEEAGRRRRQLIEQIVERDEAMLAAYLEGREPELEDLQRVIRQGVLAGWWVPALAGSAFRNRGVEPLLDAVALYLPAPGEVAMPAETTVEADLEGPLVALAFKVVNDQHGALTYVRIYRGRLAVGDSLLNASTGKQERVSRIYEMHAAHKLERQQAQMGDIVALVGLKATTTGDTLTALGHPVVLERIEAPEPVIDVAVEARTQVDQQNLLRGLRTLVQEDPSLHLRHDAESGQTLLSGMGELQIEVALENLRKRFAVEVLVGRPQVAYRETISRLAKARHVHKKQSGGPGQFAEVVLSVEPLDRGSGVVFVNQITGGAIPAEFIGSVESGVRKAAQTGVVAGFPCVDFQITLVDGSYHDRDSSTLAFELAGAAALRLALAQAGAVLLEPQMAVELVTPLEYVGACIGDVNRRRGLVRDQAMRGNAVVIAAWVPLAEMFGYIGQLRALTSGRASFSMQFDHYAVAPHRAVQAA
ncbi:elongation factor G [Parachitinimonas caeni]|uniref:Elongation factor G n=1 Tax=Parachitinimonas caeni TaxID=3031301 RepID=A0ABT7DTQ9_9NEIS|nr:elongation factor G [Parachitinimonas caeni]MDK2123450.1 elongation factor G [Parachitinimonas caeni]